MIKRLLCLILSIFCPILVISNNRALIVGIGNYDTRLTGWSKIHGDADVEMLSAALQKQGFTPQNIITLSDNKATKSNIVLNLQKLARISKPGDNVVFIFSGHGQLVVNYNEDSENTDFDQSIVPFDAYKTGRFKFKGGFYCGENHLLDDELYPMLNAIKKKIGKKGTLFVAFDACYSQGLEQDERLEFSADDINIMGPSRGTADVFKPKSGAYLKSLPVPGEWSKGGRMIVVSACKTNERNFEYKFPDSNKIVGSLSRCIALLLKDDLDFNRWIKYFSNKDYKGKGLFIQAQHPTLTVYD